MGKKTSKPLVGAKAKRMQAASALRKEQAGKQYGADGTATDEPQHVQILLIFFMSVAFAFVLTSEGTLDRLGLAITNNFIIDQFLVGPGVPVLLSDINMNLILVSVIRGFFLFLFAGLFPFMAKTYSRITDNTKTNIFILHWGTIVVLPLVLYLISSFIIPLVAEMIDLMFY